MYRLCIINSFEPISKLKENFIHQEQKRLFLSDNITGEVYRTTSQERFSWLHEEMLKLFCIIQRFYFFFLRLECGIFLENI